MNMCRGRMRSLAAGVIVLAGSLALAVPVLAEDARVEAARKEGKVVW